MRTRVLPLVVAVVLGGAGAEAQEPAANKPATQTATMTAAAPAQEQVVADSKERAFIDGHAVLKSWEATYGNLASMKVRYCEHLVLPAETGPSDGMDRAPVLTRWQYVDRVEEGLKYHIYYSTTPERTGVIESAFNGVVTAEYNSVTSEGIVKRGPSGKNLEGMNALAVAMMVNPVGPWHKPRLSLMTSLPDAQTKVLPGLATLIGQPCHVLELGDLAVAGYRIWFAHERGLLPLRVESYQGGKVDATIAVQEINSAATPTGRIWYPSRATRTFVSPRGERVEYELTVQEFAPNVATDANTFRVVFPRGAHVGDFVAQSDYVVSEDDPSGKAMVHAMAKDAPTTAPSSGIVPGMPNVTAETRAPVTTSKRARDGSGVALWRGAQWLSVMVVLAVAVGGLWWMRRAEKNR